MNDIFQFLMHRMCLLALLLGLAIGEIQGSSSDRIFIQSDSVPLAQREALLILPGFGDTKKRRKIQLAYFSNRGYDVFIPSYRDRKSYKTTLDNLQHFIEEKQLASYKKVHIFSYIVGSWALNDVLNRHPLPNIHSVVYDRSPLQERAPAVVVKRIKILGRIKVGRMLEEFAQLPYPSWQGGQQARIGILVECKATFLIKLFRRYAMSLGPLCWDPSCFQQPYHAIHYTWLTHDQMYTHMDVIGPQVLHFMETGTFLDGTRTEPYHWDYFSSLTKN